MKHFHLLLPIAAAVTGAVAFGQDGPRAVLDQGTTGESTKLQRASALVGRDLLTREDDDETEDLGDIHQILFDSASGEIDGVVISSGGIGSIGDTLRMLRWDQITWSEDDDGDLDAFVAMTEDAFDAIPKIDPEKIDMQRKGVVTDAKPVEAGSAREGRQGRDDAQRGGGARMPRPDLDAQTYRCSAGAVGELEVFGPGELRAFGSVGEVVFDVEAGRAAFITLEAMDNTYLVPFAAISIRSVYLDATPEEDELAVVSHMNRNGLKGAPAIDEDAKRTIDNPSYVQSVQRFFEAAKGEEPTRRGRGDERGRGGDPDRPQPVGGGQRRGGGL